MPDTGAPWNIPYVTSADLVSDWPSDSLAVANAIDAGLDVLLAGGIGQNVAQGTLTATFVTSSNSFVDITGLSATITPSSATSKVLLIAQIAVGGASTQTGNYRFTGGNADTYVGGASGNKTQAVFGGIQTVNPSAVAGLTMVYLDSPATTSAVTYKAQVMVGSASAGTVRINLSSTDTSNDTNDRVRGASSLIAIEVAA